MNLFRPKPNSLNSPETEQAASPIANIGYTKLEPRQVLSASFVLGTGTLILDGFDADQDLSFAHETAFIDGSLQDAYVFDVASGSWTGDDSGMLVELEDVSGGTNNRLEIATSLFGGPANADLTFDGEVAGGGEVELTQTSTLVTFNTLDVSNFTNFDRSMVLNTRGDVTAGYLTVADSNPADAIHPAVDLEIKTEGQLSAFGPLHNSIVNQDAEIRLIADGANNDVEIFRDTETALGNIIVEADDSVIMIGSATLDSNGAGNITVDAGLDGLTGDDGNEIQMTFGSFIDGGTGQVSLDTNSGGDVLLSEITTLNSGDAITVDSGGQIVDGFFLETPNLMAANGRINLTADDDIGSSVTDGDIDIQSSFLGFNTGGEFYLTDGALGLTIDRTSMSVGGGELRANHFLTLGANVSVGGSAIFAAGNSTTIGDHLAINNNAVVELNSATDASLQFEAGDDIVIEIGQIATSGAGTHSINLVADNEGTADADRGSITNGPGTGSAIVTNDLELVAFGGIGDASSGPNADQPIRIDVDRLTATNQGQNDLLIDESGSIELVDLENVDGAIFVTGVGQIEVTEVTTGETEVGEDDTDDISIVSTTGSIAVTRIDSADDLLLQATVGNIRDNADGEILVESDATLVAGTEIELTDSPSDLLEVQGNASFDAVDVSVGQDGEAAGSATALNTFLGSLTVNADTAIVVEDNSTQFSGDSEVADFSVASAGDITNSAAAQLLVTGHGQLNTPDGTFLGAQTSDSFSINTLGMVASNVHVELDSSVILDGRAPNQAPISFGTLASQGTEVDQTLFVTSTGSIEQQLGQLNATDIGLQAGGHVHLARIISGNENAAIAAGTAAPLTDATTILNLNTLADVVNSEVISSLPQSIALIHEGTLNVSTVDSPLNGQTLTGLTTTDGSIFVDALQEVSIQQDIVALSPTSDPQVTVYAESGTATDSAITFDGGQIEVGGPTNTGIVNKLQTSAVFFDEDGFVLPGTTEILLLNTDGTANQDIVVQYADPGEAGYRAIVVWDRDNQPGQPVEIINTFVSDPDLDTEEHEDEILQDNESIVRPIGANEGGFETFSKFPVYSKEAIIAHQDNPNVFSTVTIRSDQDINLFTGPLASVDNLLNEVTETLRAELDSPKRSDPVPPKANPINPIEIKAAFDLPTDSSAPDDSSSLTFSREVQPFETGDLKWVLVEIPMSEMEETDGEVRLKDPTKVFSEAKDAEINDLDDEIGENEIDKIIREIETNQKAEAGFWYKIFKDYRNRDDELFFYHFKSGEQQPTEVPPQSDFDETTEPENNHQYESEPDRSQLERSVDPESDPLNPLHENDSSNLKSQPSQHVLSAGSLMMAGLMIKANKKPSHPGFESNPGRAQKTFRPKVDPAKLKSNEDATLNRFGRLDRLKRKLKNRFRPPGSPTTQ